MSHVYFKRYRMEVDLCAALPAGPLLPEGYRLVPWRRALLREHAAAKFRSFREEIDANVFPCLGEFNGCMRLMGEISKKPGFLHEATWLAQFRGPLGGEYDVCGTIQGVRDPEGYGSIQNIGVVPEHRGIGLGAVLLTAVVAMFEGALRGTYGTAYVIPMYLVIVAVVPFRPLQVLGIGGSAYHMVWGRHQNKKISQELAEAWGVEQFVLGHQPAEMGWETEADNILIIASDHDHGVALPMDLSRTYSRDELIEALVPLNSVSVPTS